MSDKRPTRWQKAKADWPGFKWDDLIPAAIGLLVALGALALSNFSGDTLAEVGIVGGSAIGAALLRAFAQLAWAWLQAPMRLLTEEVLPIRERVEQLQPAVKTVGGGKPQAPVDIGLSLCSNSSVAGAESTTVLAIGHREEASAGALVSALRGCEQVR